MKYSVVSSPALYLLVKSPISVAMSELNRSRIWALHSLLVRLRRMCMPSMATLLLL